MRLICDAFGSQRGPLSGYVHHLRTAGCAEHATLSDHIHTGAGVTDLEVVDFLGFVEHRVSGGSVCVRGCGRDEGCGVDAG